MRVSTAFNKMLARLRRSATTIPYGVKVTFTTYAPTAPLPVRLSDLGHL